jgi:PAS domain S-box-containing protein
MSGPEDRAATPAGQLRVLVIDDDEVDRERVRRFLARAGVAATVFEHADPIAALGALRRLAPDVIVLDYNFPKHDGLSVLREIRELDGLIPVIVMTGQDETALAVELMKAGAVDYIPKAGLTPQRLAHSVRHALRLRASELATHAAQEALRASEEFNRRVIASSHDCINVLDLEGRLLSMSPAGQQRLAIKSFSAVRGSPWADFWKGEHHEAARTALNEGRAGRVGRFVGFWPSQDGTPLWWDVLVTPILGPDGRPERLLASSRDVTDQRRQTEFEQQLIAIVSHDLRNPIAAMMMAGALLVEQLPPDSRLAKTAARVVSSGNRATRLIRDLLDFAQARLGGGLPLDRRETDIHALCRQAVDEITVNHPDRSIVHTAEGEGRGMWDPDRMAQVIGNLTRNAVTYSPQGSPVTVRSRDQDAGIRLEVHNEGYPIPLDVMATLFHPFKRGERKHDPERSIGLGLFIVREIVTAHGGSVNVHSTAADGTTFSVDLPKV